MSATTIYDNNLHLKAEETLLKFFFFLHSYSLGIYALSNFEFELLLKAQLHGTASN